MGELSLVAANAHTTMKVNVLGNEVVHDEDGLPPLDLPLIPSVGPGDAFNKFVQLPEITSVLITHQIGIHPMERPRERRAGVLRRVHLRRELWQQLQQLLRRQHHPTSLLR